MAGDASNSSLDKPENNKTCPRIISREQTPKGMSTSWLVQEGVLSQAGAQAVLNYLHRSQQSDQKG